MRTLVYSNLLIAASAALITHETYYLLGVEPRWSPLLTVVCFATLLVYNLDRLVDAVEEDASGRTERHRWIDRHRTVLWGSTAVATVGTAASVLFVRAAVLWGLVPLGALALGYTLPILWGESGPYRLKDVAGLKIFLIAAVWAGATALLPALQIGASITDSVVVLTVAERGLFIFALTLPFDIRDMERDRASEIRTIPLMIGAQRTRTLALVCTAGFALLAVAHRGLTVDSAALPCAVSAGVTFTLLWAESSDRPELYYVGALDGMIALQWALVAGWSSGV